MDIKEFLNEAVWFPYEEKILTKSMVKSVRSEVSTTKRDLLKAVLPVLEELLTAKNEEYYGDELESITGVEFILWLEVLLKDNG